MTTKEYALLKIYGMATALQHFPRFKTEEQISHLLNQIITITEECLNRDNNTQYK